jgi:hypothetical protein
MKKCLHANALAVATVATSIALASCGKEELAVAPEPVDPVVEVEPEPTPPEPEPEPEPEPGPAASGIAAKLNGYWVPDKDGMLKIAQDLIAQQSGPEGNNPAAMAMATQMVEGMLNSMVGKMEDGKSTLYSPNGIEESTYEVTGSDEATGEFTLETTDPDGNTENATGQFQGDLLSLTIGGQPIVLTRIDEAEFEKRKTDIKNAPAPGLPPGIPVPTPPPGTPTLTRPPGLPPGIPAPTPPPAPDLSSDPPSAVELPPN